MNGVLKHDFQTQCFSQDIDSVGRESICVGYRWRQESLMETQYGVDD